LCTLPVSKKNTQRQTNELTKR